MCEIIVIDYSPVPGFRTPVSAMSEFVGNWPVKFISFCPLGFESSANRLPEEQKAEDTQTAAQVSEVHTVVVGETSNSLAKNKSKNKNGGEGR